MKTFLLLLTFFFVADAVAQGDLSATLKGQNQSTKLTVGTIGVPNNQATKTGSITALIENENDNILSNPGFEHSTYSTGWTLGGTGTHSVETSTLLFGAKAAKVVTSAQTLSIIQDSTLYAAQFGASGVQGYVRAWISNTAASATVCARAAGVTLTGNSCVTLATDGLYKQYEIPVVLSTTSNGLEVSATSTTGTTIVDRTYVGVANAMPEVAQAQLAGEAYIAATTSCSWSRTNTALGAFTSTAACPGPTVTKQNVGSWQATDSDLPRFAVNNLPPGQYVAEFTNNSVSAGATTSVAIFDGTTTCVGKPGNNSGSTVSQVTTCFFEYTSSGNRSFELYAAAASGAYTVSNSQTSQPNGITFRLYYYPPASKIYSQLNSEGWVAFTPTGSWSTNTTYSGKWRKDGSFMEIQYYLTTAGAPTSATLTLNMPTVNGATAVIDTTKFGDPAVGANTRLDSNGAVLDAGTVTYATAFAQYNSTTNLLVRTGNSSAQAASVTQVSPMTWASGDTLWLYVRVPVVGFTESMITGTFANVVTAPGISKPKTCFYAFGGASATLAAPTECTSGTCVEVYDSCAAVSPPLGGTGLYTDLTFSAGIYAALTPIECDCTAYDTTSTQARDCRPYFITSDQTWSTTASGGAVLNVVSTDTDGIAQTSYVMLKCTGQAP